VGGDAFDLIPLPKDRLGVVIADVSGKGVPGALYMAMTRIAFRVATIYAESPLEVVSMVHQLMSPELTRGRFITAVYMEVDTNSGNVICCRLGHDPILKFNNETEEIESYTPQGAAIGILPTDAFKKKIVQEEFTIQPGDRVLLYTDGITEAANNADEEFGMERIEGFMVANAKLTSDQFVNKLITDVKFFIEDRDIQDDLTVISLALPVAAGAEEAETADKSEAEAPESV
ncbi:MAG: PP2C family protein-serine/threonine phosphatase, partial [Planctomycetota bacterium]|nr:PP2C family protein-serine/threonine phosphatase [Planctomycetota bacterium]